MSILKVNTIQDKGGNTLLSSDGAGVISSGGAITNTPSFSAKLSSNQVVSASAYTILQFNNEQWDSDGKFDTSTYRFTPTIAGKYHVDIVVMFLNLSGTGNRVQLTIYKNGTFYAMVGDFAMTTTGAADPTFSLSTDMELSSTDYIDIRAYQNTAGGVELGSDYCFFSAHKIIGA